MSDSEILRRLRAETDEALASLALQMQEQLAPRDVLLRAFPDEIAEGIRLLQEDAARPEPR